MAILQTEQLTKIYGKGDTAVTALDQVNLTVTEGEFVAVMGPSGVTFIWLYGPCCHAKCLRICLANGPYL